jgi:hypothetical protein
MENDNIKWMWMECKWTANVNINWMRIECDVNVNVPFTFRERNANKTPTTYKWNYTWTNRLYTVEWYATELPWNAKWMSMHCNSPSVFFKNFDKISAFSKGERFEFWRSRQHSVSHSVSNSIQDLVSHFIPHSIRIHLTFHFTFQTHHHSTFHRR